ncbi:MAG TPA: DUF1501 domain-containing protein [Acidimicrobiia bacterium]|nr:DUF1501 domain-containing protein [Acidimicrobiia bacterium]
MAAGGHGLDALVDAVAQRRVSRRRVLQAGVVGAGGVALAPWLSTLDRLRAFAAPPVGANEGVLVIITLDGGNDGLNTLVPAASGRYQDLRGALAIPPEQALMVSSSLGLHPALTTLKQRYDSGDVAIVRGVGYQPADLSHFESMDIWMHGWGGHDHGGPMTGWLGRYVDGLPNAGTEPLYAVSIGSHVPDHLHGERSRASGLPVDIGGAFGVDREDPSDIRMFDALSSFGDESTGLGEWADLTGDVERNLMTLTQSIQPAYVDPLPEGHLAEQLVLCARLINANLGIRVLNVSLHGFDTHDTQPNRHAELLTELDAGIAAFTAALAPAWSDNVTLMTWSEFGRRPFANGDTGTDHGTSSCLFVIGKNVRGGMYGEQPRLDALDNHGNLRTHVDFRSVYATVLSRWLGADDVEVLGHSYAPLDLFERGPGTDPPPSTRVRGYWVTERSGTNRALGAAPDVGSVSGLRSPVVGAAGTASGKGLWTVASDGGIFSFGDAKFYGSTGGMRLVRPVVGMAATPSGKGYWLVASDGGIFSFGDAKFRGSIAGSASSSIASMCATPTGAGYWVLGTDGAVYGFGDATYYGRGRAGAVSIVPVR